MMTSTSECDSASSISRYRPPPGRVSPVAGRGGLDIGHMSAEAGERLVDFLRRRHPVKTADHVAASTGVPAETVRKWFGRGSTPSFGAMLALVAAYGPPLLAASMGTAPDWLGRAASDAAVAEIRAEIADLEARLSRIGGGI